MSKTTKKTTTKPKEEVAPKVEKAPQVEETIAPVSGIPTAAELAASINAAGK